MSREWVFSKLLPRPAGARVPAVAQSSRPPRSRVGDVLATSGLSDIAGGHIRTFSLRHITTARHRRGTAP